MKYKYKKQFNKTKIIIKYLWINCSLIIICMVNIFLYQFVKINIKTISGFWMYKFYRYTCSLSFSTLGKNCNLLKLINLGVA